MAILITTSTNDFDPTEVAIPWKIFRAAEVDIRFATDTGTAGKCDQRMIDGHGLGLLKPLFIAQGGARSAYGEMLDDPAFQNPLSFDDIDVNDFDGLILSGGHAKGMIAYLESSALQHAIAAFFGVNKPVGAICHGVVAACRAQNPDTGKSILFGRKTTALLKRQEMLAYQLTRINLGDYYRTYPTTVEDEVTAALENKSDFLHGPTPLLRDDMTHLSRGFTVRDGNYLSARWPGDAHKFSTEFLSMVDGQ